MTIDEILEQHNQMKQRLEALETKTTQVEQKVNEAENFNKRLIDGLLKAESDHDLVLLPSGKFYGKDI